MAAVDWWLDKYRVNEAGCWLWIGYKNHKGYGVTHQSGKTWQAHRFSYLVHRGPFDLELFVLHSCDARACVNPDHLFLGTNDDNMKDMVRKGRQAKGQNLSEKISDAIKRSTKHPSKTGEYRNNLKARTGTAHPCTKLTDPQCEKLRIRYAQGDIGVRAVGLLFGISEETARKIIKGRRLPPSIRQVG